MLKVIYEKSTASLTFNVEILKPFLLIIIQRVIDDIAINNKNKYINGICI